MTFLSVLVVAFLTVLVVAVTFVAMPVVGGLPIAAGERHDGAQEQEPDAGAVVDHS
ncbi:MAG: hypothetical protein KF878_01170 [Planctomycetes bacterium]|nr:hypothetical protein [Planctomycetota bacterium]